MMRVQAEKSVIPHSVWERTRMRILPLFSRGIRFYVVGWIGMAVNSGCLYLMKSVLGIPLIPSSMIAIECAIIHNFILHRHWTWKERNGYNTPFFKQLIIYNAMTGLVDFTVNVSVLFILTEFFGVYYMIANIVGMILGPLFKFWINDKVVFRKKADIG